MTYIWNLSTACFVKHAGYGAPLKNVPPERFNSLAVPKSYQSPWEQAGGDNSVLADTLFASLPLPDRPGYKSFNRWELADT